MEEKKKMEREARARLYQLTGHILLVVLAVCLGFGVTDTDSFYINQNMRHMVVDSFVQKVIILADCFKYGI